jgi:hypothetical protein
MVLRTTVLIQAEPLYTLKPRAKNQAILRCDHTYRSQEKCEVEKRKLNRRIGGRQMPQVHHLKRKQ